MQKMLMNVDVESFYEGDKLCLEKYLLLVKEGFLENLSNMV